MSLGPTAQPGVAGAQRHATPRLARPAVPAVPLLVTLPVAPATPCHAPPHSSQQPLLASCRTSFTTASGTLGTLHYTPRHATPRLFWTQDQPQQPGQEPGPGPADSLCSKHFLPILLLLSTLRSDLTCSFFKEDDARGLHPVAGLEHATPRPQFDGHSWHVIGSIFRLTRTSCTRLDRTYRVLVTRRPGVPGDTIGCGCGRLQGRPGARLLCE